MGLTDEWPDIRLRDGELEGWMDEWIVKTMEMKGERADEIRDGGQMEEPTETTVGNVMKERQNK